MNKRYRIPAVSSTALLFYCASVCGSSPESQAPVLVSRRAPTEKSKYIDVSPSFPLSSPTPVSFIINSGGHVPLLQKGETIRCVEVIKGDVLKLANGDTVRLLGVEASESAFFQRNQDQAEAATSFTKRLAEGQPLTFEYDAVVRDEQNRLIAYVYLPNGLSLNEQVLYNGQGHAFSKYPCKHISIYRQLELQARDARRGLWRKSSY